MSAESNEVDRWFRALLANGETESQAVHDAYQQLENAGLIPRVVVRRYICAKGCGVRATVIRVSGRTLARTSPYKYSRGMNAAKTAPEARATRTLDGERHWPGHTYDVDSLAVPGVGIDVTCRHGIRALMALDIIDATKDVTPGRQVKPQIL